MFTCTSIMASRLLSSAHFIQVAEGMSMLLKLSVVPDNTAVAVPSTIDVASTKQCLWFEDKHLQELLVLAHQLVYTASQSFSLTVSSKTAQLNFTRSGSMRVLYCFEEHKVRQSLLQFSGRGSTIPDVTITSDYGRKVFSYDTTAGKDHTYKSYRLLPTSLVMYVDHFELPSTLGVIKIRKGLDPNYTLLEDITLYFKMEESAVTDQSGPLTKVPLNQLKRSRRRKSSCPKKREELSKPVSSSGSTAKSGPVYCQLTIPAALADKEVTSTNNKDNKLTNCIESFVPPVPEDLPDELLLADLTPTTSQSAIPTDHQPVIHCSQDLLADVQDPPNQTASKADVEIINIKDNELTSCDESLIPPVPEDLLDELLLAELTPTTSQPATPTDHQSIIQDLPVPTVIQDSPIKAIESPKTELQQTQNVTVDLLDDLFTVDITECDQPSSCTNSPQKHNSVCDESLSFSDIVDLTEDEPETSTAAAVANDAQSQKLEKKIREVSSVLFKGCSEIKEIPLLNLRKWLKFRKKTLVEIYSGKRPSERHSKFKDTIAVRRNIVLQNAINTAMLSQEQLDSLSSDVVNMFCADNESEFTYAWLVMFPEAVIYLHMDFLQIDYKEAEEKMYSYTTYNMETDTGI